MIRNPFEVLKLALASLKNFLFRITKQQNLLIAIDKFSGFKKDLLIKRIGKIQFHNYRKHKVMTHQIQTDVGLNP
jgi:hypothetical protein